MQAIEAQLVQEDRARGALNGVAGGGGSGGVVRGFAGVDFEHSEACDERRDVTLDGAVDVNQVVVDVVEH